MFNLFDTKNNPIIFFYKEGCPRSKYAKEMLDRKKIPYKYINTSNNKEYLKDMFKLLKLQSSGMNKVLYPLFLIDGRLDHDIANLRLYIKDLASKH
ncbi:glutaredoxin domain-containing protein [Allomuricauda sp. F6463D]|uniref:glutaredoxin domain-containing protein n=1 Tax=Allomuricauda sp. F6463D TaxID=2926409 RepID=UPI00397AA599